ncbi:MAG TPA: hypothetical protein VM818_24760 [Vicinamibacterales bacterium]|nr:hypothetical protein [Vicinamibacterales bacterium]
MRRIALVVLAGSTSWSLVRRFTDRITAAVTAATPGSYSEVDTPSSRNPCAVERDRLLKSERGSNEHTEAAIRFLFAVGPSALASEQVREFSGEPEVNRTAEREALNTETEP